MPGLIVLSLLVGLWIGRQMGTPPAAELPAAGVAGEAGLRSGATADGRSAEQAGARAAGAGSLDVVGMNLEAKLTRIEDLKRSPSLSNAIETLQLIADMSERDLRQALDQMGRQGMGSIHDFMMPYYLFTAWVEKDPQSAYAYFDGEANPMQQQMYAQSLFSAWAATDPEGAIAAAEKMSDKMKRNSAMSAIAMSLAGKDPNRAFDLLSSREDTQPHNYQTVFMLWAGQDVDAAMAKIETLAPGEVRNSALAGVVNGIATRDIDRAATLAMSLEREVERERAVQMIMHTWIQQDLDRAIEFISGMEPSESKNRMIQSSVWALTRSDPERAMEFVDTHMTGQARDNALTNVISQMARENPESAARLISNLPYGRVYSNSIRNVARQWGADDPEAALEWARSLGQGEEKKWAIDSVIGAFAQNQTDTAKDYLRAMPQGEERNALAGQIARKLAQDDPRAALDWAKTHASEPALFADAYQAVIEGWAARNPRDLVEYLRVQGDSEQLEKHARTIADNWARTDVVGAARWAEGLEGEAQVNAIGRVAWEWLEHNTEEASEWIADLPRGAARDGAVSNLVNKVHRSDPEAAFVWAATIESENTRSQRTRQVIQRMKQDGDSAAARELVNDSTLDAATKESLLKILD